jgi:hypothetical protein
VEVVVDLHVARAPDVLGEVGSPQQCTTSVGAETSGRKGRTSISMLRDMISRAISGVQALRS